ncbi:hypothetical protein BKG91_06280 [Rodentibacter caecimuris]|nr:hypothetical protein [Rodentibacter heylii]OOF74444.1 hypothetical protein BKG91_06280 [Rodentibacter heylii]
MPKNDGTFTIPENKVKDGSEVTAIGTDDKGNAADADATAGNNPDTTADKPTLTPETDGSVSVKPGEDNTKVVVKYTDEDGAEKTATLTKGADGNWTSDNPDVTPKNDGTFTIPENKVKDGSEVTAIGTDDKGNAADADAATAGNNPNTTADKPVITAENDGSVTVKAGDDNVIMGVKFKDENDKDQTVAIKKENGEWILFFDSGDNNVTVDKDSGIVKIPADKLKDGGEVNALGRDNLDNRADADPVNAGSDPKNAKPITEDKDGDGTPDGIVSSPAAIDETGNNNKVTTTIKLDNNNGVDNLPITIVGTGGKPVSAEDFEAPVVKYTDPTDNTEKVLAPNADGTYNVPAGVTELKVEHTAKADNSTEGAETGKVKVGNVEGNEVTVNDTSTTPLPDEAKAPTLAKDPANQGGAIVTPDPSNDQVVVTFHNEKGEEQTVTVKKGDDGTWTPEGQLPERVTLDPATGKVTITPDAVKDGGQVNATGKESGKTDKAGEPLTTDTDAKNAKPITEDKDGDGTPDGIVSSPAAIDETGNNNKVTTTIKLDNNNGVDNLPITIVGTGGKPVSAEDFEAPVVKYTDPTDNTEKVLAPNADGTYNVPAGVTELKVEHTAKADNSTEGAETGKVKVGNVEGNEVTVNDTSTTPLPDEAKAPTLAKDPANQGGAIVTPDPSNDQVVVTFPNEKGEEQTVTVKKGDDGTWTPEGQLPERVTLDPATGKVTITPDAVKDGGQVNATGKESGKTDKAGEPLTTDADAKNAKPITEDKDGDGTPDGVVSSPAAIDETGNNNKVTTTIKLDNNNGVDNLPITIVGTGGKPVSAEDFEAPVVKYTDPTDNTEKVLAPNADGTYNVPAGVTELKVEHTAKADNSTEGAETGKVKVGNVEGNEVTVNDTSTTPLPDEAKAPTLAKDPANQGGAIVTPNPSNDLVFVTFPNEKGEKQTVTVEKGDDGTWTPEGQLPAGVTVDPATGKVTIAPDAVKDGGQVNATGKESGKTDKAGEPLTTDTDAKNAKPIIEDKDGDGKPDGVVSEPPTIDETGANKVTTTIKLDNNNGVDNLPITIVGTGNKPVSAEDFEAPVVKYTDPTDNTEKVLAPNADGTYNVPAGVTELKVEHTAKEDNSTEGAETGKVKVGNVEGNEITVNDTSIDAAKLEIDITEIAGDSQSASVKDDGTAAGDVYAQISPAEAAGGFLIRGTSKDISGDITVTIGEKSGAVIVTKTVTPAADGSWSVNIGANELTGYAATKEYEVKAVGKDANNTSVEDIDYTASTPQVTAIKLVDNLNDEPLEDGTYQYSDYYTQNNPKYVGDVAKATNPQTATSLANGLTNDKDAVLEFTLDKAPTAGQTVKVYRYTLSESSDVNNPYTEHGKTDVTADMLASTDGLTYTVTPKGNNVLSETYSQNYRYEVVVEDKNGDALSTGDKGKFDFRLDTLVEQMSVEKFDIATGEVIFAPVGLSEVGATIEYRYATSTGKTNWSAPVTADGEGKYHLTLNNFNRKVSGALELRIIDAAGNVSETKVSVLRNLTAEMNLQQGPDPRPAGSTIGAPITYGNGSMDDAAVTIPKQPLTNASNGGFVTTNGNDTVIFGLDFNHFGNMGVYNGTFGATGSGTFGGFDAGAGDDSVQFRGTAQSMYGQKIAMGAGNDRVAIAGGLLVGNYTIDLGQAEDKAGDTNILYVGGNTANATEIKFFSGAGNDRIQIDGTFDGNKTVDLGEGNNELRVGYGAAGGTDLVKKIDFTAGSGDDVISVKGSISTIAGQKQTFNLGEGDNFIEVGKDVDTDGTFSFGNGNDTVNIKDTLKGGTFNFSGGDDVMTVGSILKSAEDNVHINMGSGNDSLTITGSRVNTGNGAIDGGEGNDTIFLHGTDLKLDMNQVLNFDTIDMRAITGGTGNQKVTLTLADLQRLGDNITQLYIKGDVGDTVDFGNNGGNGSDNQAKNGTNGIEFKDSGGALQNNWNVWQKTGTDIVKDGVVYDKYTYYGATGQVNNEEVYIQQGVSII